MRCNARRVCTSGVFLNVWDLCVKDKYPPLKIILINMCDFTYIKTEIPKYSIAKYAYIGKR